MIYNYPFFGFPNYYNHSRNMPFMTSAPSPSYSSFVKKQPYANAYNHEKNNSSNTQKRDDKQTSFLNLFGISLNFDDVLLICVILFLYNEKVDDYYLLFALIMLLLT